MLGPSAVEEHAFGFKVKFSSHYNIKYEEKDHQLLVEIEPGIDWAIYPNTIRSWQAPHENEPISEGKKREIIERIDAALNFLKIPHRFL